MLEWMLSVDNLFVYRLIFEIYKCPDWLQQKPLFVGILGVIVLRLILFVVGEVRGRGYWRGQRLFFLLVMRLFMVSLVE